jgi:hypothetical protein
MSGPSVSRRTAMWTAGAAALVGTLALSGCDVDPHSSSPAAASPAPDPDEHVLLAARAELADLVARLSASTGRADLADLEQVHRTQLAALGGQPYPPTERARPLRPRRVAGRERVAVSRFTAWAGQVDNGDLARVLAAIAAGIRMQPVLTGTA